MPLIQVDERQRTRKAPQHAGEAPAASRRRGGSLFREVVEHLRQHRTRLRIEWAQRIIEARLLTAMNRKEVAAEVASIYDNYVEALETGTFEALQAYARDLSERIIPGGVQTHEVVGIVLLLRDVLPRALFAKYQADQARLTRGLNTHGLVQALEFLAEGVHHRTGLRVKVGGSTGGRLAPPVEAAIYRCVQEALSNVTRHAKASKVKVDVRRGARTIRTMVTDDGV